MAALFVEQGGEVFLGHEVTELAETTASITIATQSNGSKEKLVAKYMIACCGLMADRVAAMLNIDSNYSNNSLSW